MAKWIRLTSSAGQDEVYVNLDNAVMMLPIRGKGTRIAFGAGKDQSTEVKETIAQIKQVLAKGRKPQA